MAKLGTIQAKWRRDFTDSEGREAYTEYALRADGTVVVKNGVRWQEWHDWGWTVAMLKGVKFRSTPTELAAQLEPKGYHQK